MNRCFYVGLALALAGGAAQALLPGDSAEGQRLHAANCTSCHNDSVYLRKDRKVVSLGALTQQIENCTHMTKKDFSMGEKQSLVKFLNNRYYHFE